jgi:hypothetical protein
VRIEVEVEVEVGCGLRFGHCWNARASSRYLTGPSSDSDSTDTVGRKLIPSHAYTSGTNLVDVITLESESRVVDVSKQCLGSVGQV